MRRTATTLTGGLLALTLLTACGSGGGQSAGTPTPAPTTASTPTTTTSTTPSASPSAYHPMINAADFTATVDHPYFPLRPGATKLYDGTRDGKPHHAEVNILTRKRKVMGVDCVVVYDTVTSNGALVEKTEDWYAQDKAGNVWYFGENTAEYKNGVVSSTHGTWEAGVDGAQPGIILHAAPKVGQAYYQEYRPGQAEDRAKVLTLDSVFKVPAGTFHRVITTEDSDPLNPDRTDKKWYAPGFGLIHSTRIRSGHHEESSLVRVVKP
jgi:hypothetical protein